MTLLTIGSVLLIVYGLVSRRYDRALAWGGVTSAGAALVLGPVAVPTFYAVAVGLVAVLGVNRLASRRRPRTSLLEGVPGASLLLAFVVWAVLVTFTAPFMFPGLATVTASSAPLEPGRLTTSNIAQMLYLALSVAIVVMFAHTAGVGPQTIGLLLTASVLLSFWRFLGLNLGIPFPYGVLDNSPAFAYIETAPGGALRFRGIYPEPAALATVAAASAVYSVSAAFQVRGLRRLGHLLVAGIAIQLGIVSTSTTFLVVGMGMLALFAVVAVADFLRGRVALPPAGAYALLVTGLAALWFVPLLYRFVQEALSVKIDSDSYDARSGTDAASYQVFLDTYGWGVGLGSGRASSLIPTVLSTVGFVGAVLLVAALAAVVIPALRVRRARPVLWVLATVALSGMVSGPDLTPPSGLLWLCVGVLARIVVEQRALDAAASAAGPALDRPAQIEGARHRSHATPA
ncbi:hypothetical protein RN607_05225 [Demequina capsici]|uniref:Uncharacterized protein n=1 Tax=Demequina capsici TaxID=3075620 RepID=A0AA96J8I8_9MICO|nr:MULTISPECIES: hypothetical protein [unclassified Demequina]WNM25515.1 hypothetical protein RN606_05040 [Demequina sp. OYTSA14]WNM28406.1 hypothetical protein RN607_05225 [Demequina sp. PMTSA13]